MIHYFALRYVSRYWSHGMINISRYRLGWLCLCSREQYNRTEDVTVRSKLYERIENSYKFCWYHFKPYGKPHSIQSNTIWISFGTISPYFNYYANTSPRYQHVCVLLQDAQSYSLANWSIVVWTHLSDVRELILWSAGLSRNHECENP